MRKRAFLLSIALVLGLAGHVVAGNDALSKPYTVTLGDWLAYRLAEMIRVNPDLSAPTLVTYDKEKKVILVEIYGSRSGVEGAKKSLLAWWGVVKDRHMPDVEKNYGVYLREADYTVVYFNRTAKRGPKEKIRMEDGKLLLPQK